MEAFSLLKYWRGGGGGTPVSASSDCRETSGTTTIVTAVARDAVDSDGEGNDDGPFFDLEFAVPDDEDEAEDKDGEEEDENEDDNASTCAENGEEGEEHDEEDEESDGGGTDGEREFNFTLSSGSSNDRADPNLALSPSDDLFFKGRLVPVEPSALALTNIGAEPNSSKPPQFPVSLLKSATKFRVMMLGFKKSKQSVAEKAEPTRSSSPKKQKPPLATAAESKEKKFLTVKFKVEEVPIMSLFTRDNSTTRTSSTNKPPVSQKQSIAAAPSEELASSDEKRFSKDVMQKYLKKVKPLYVRVSKRYGDKLRFSGQLNSASGAKPSQAPPPTEAQKPAPTTRPAASTEKNTKPVTAATENTAPSTAKTHKQVNIPAGLREVCKHLGKSRSASSAVAAAPPGPVISKRRDDSLLQQQDGIQSAILHCKRSFNASRDSESSVLRRSASEPAEEKVSGGADNKSRISFKEEDGVA